MQIWFQEDFRNFWDACPWEEDLSFARKVGVGKHGTYTSLRHWLLGCLPGGQGLFFVLSEEKEGTQFGMPSSAALVLLLLQRFLSLSSDTCLAPMYGLTGV